MTGIEEGVMIHHPVALHKLLLWSSRLDVWDLFPAAAWRLRWEDVPMVS